MRRMFEAMAIQAVFAPQSVAASTDKTSAYVDASGADETAFLVSCAPLGKGKSLTVSLMAASDSTGSDAKEIGKAVFTDAVGTDAQVAVVSCRTSAAAGRYLAVKFRHDGAAEMVCSVTAAGAERSRPAENGWKLVV